MWTKLTAASFLILSVLLQVGAAANQRYCLTDEGPKQINISEQICCNGTLHERFLDSKERDCCPEREQLYDTASEICCGIQKVERFTIGGDERECLYGNIIVKGKKHLNCYGEDKYVPVASGDFLCCGYEVYEFGKEDCCQTINKTTGEPMYTKYSSRLSHGEDCCGAVKYNKNGDKECQNDELFSKYIGQCGGKNFNITEFVCCDNKNLKPVPRHSSSPNPQYKCQNGKVFDETIDMFVPGDPVRNTKDRIIPITHNLCGNSSYDRKNSGQFMCCNDHLWNISSGDRVECCGESLIRYEKGEKCCSGKMFNETNKICCNGSLMDKYGTDRNCCGSRLPYDEKTHVCCLPSMSNTYKIIPKAKVDDTDCCNGHPYNRYKEKEKMKACGLRSFNSFCDIRHLATRVCQEKRRLELRIRINKITDLKRQQEIEAKILKPRRYRNQTIVLLTVPDECRRFKKYKVFRLFTNRKFKQNKRLRITDKDIVAQKTKKFNKLYRSICPVIRHVNRKLRGR